MRSGGSAFRGMEWMRVSSLRLLLVFGLTLMGLASARALGEAPPPAPQDGQLVQWRDWRFRWDIRLREGLVLSDVTFAGKSVLKHAALAEIFVPYDPGQPRPEDSLDGMGRALMELVPGRDCIPGTVCQMFDREGKRAGKPVVAMHEEATGPLYMGDMGRAYGSMLILWCSAQLGDYTYFIRWRFRDDGVLMPQVGLTGRLSHTRRGQPSTYGTVVDRDARGTSVVAPSHVHNFYYRLDFDIDGPANDRVEEFNHRQDRPGESLSSKDAWTPLPHETARSFDGPGFRSWRVADRVSKNRLGHPRSYELMPGGNGVFRGARAEPFAQAELWVTRHRAEEFPLSSEDPRKLQLALPAYANGEPLEGQDVVVWYAMHVHHLPRTEDWPMMPVEWADFSLVPRDFLDRSPLRPE